MADARAYLGDSLRLALSHGETPRLLEGLTFLAEVWMTRGRPREAAALLALALAHPGTEYRVRRIAERQLGELRLPPGEAQAPGHPARLEVLTGQALAWLDLTGPPRPG